ncbi:sulfatase-like hydrolase/transferase [Phytoactinopolyspora endophytica]|uniref:sulfatase-like hydrolase/transferase n=1 Tax=Phytoactinopolyspora endophytica TaxID=1642495 RepID=UPI00101BDB26|nr:sulfatase-like hydrolase/transferase [Phytoactinopolyspora endophytica]
MRTPNVLYLMSDQHAASVLGCAGDEVALTPNLDRLAARGTRLTNMYCPSPICVPSRMSMLSGRHPFRNQVWTNDHPLPGSIATWPHSLGASGYRTRLDGRLHSIGTDQLLGFSERRVGDHSPNHPGGRTSDLGVLMGTAAPKRISLQRSGPGSNPYQWHDVDVTRAAVTSIEEFGARQRAGDGRPFALSVGFMLPHQPYVADPEDYALFEGRVPPPAVSATSAPSHPHHRSWREQTDITEVSAEEQHRARIAYYAMTYRLDVMVGEVLDALERQGLAENTLVIYTSDHGEHLGERGLWWKQTFYDESAKIPCLVSWPGRITAGTTHDHVAGGVDLTATLLDAAGASPLPNADGRSFLDVVTGTPGAREAWADEAYSEYCTDDGNIQRMVRRGPWKLNYYDAQPAQLFNLDADPHELTDLAGDPGHAGTHAEIHDELRGAVLDGWDPAQVRAEIDAMSEDLRILTEWAARTGPPDTHRWRLTPRMSELESPGTAAGSEVPE